MEETSDLDIYLTALRDIVVLISTKQVDFLFAGVGFPRSFNEFSLLSKWRNDRHFEHFVEVVILGYNVSDEPIRARKRHYPSVWLILKLLK